MSEVDGFDFTLDEETEKRLYDLMTDMDTRNTNRFWIKDKRGYHAEYVKIIRCKDCKHWCTDDGMFKDIDERQWHHCSHIGIDTEEYFFCSEAERKEE